jgi:hypothetical protein
MATLYAMNDAFGLIEEVTHGTDPTGAPTNFMPLDNIKVSYPQATIRPATTRRNDGYGISALRKGRTGPLTVSITGPATYDAMGVIWDAALGGSGSSGGGDPYTHTYSTAAPELPSFTGEHILDGTSNSRRGSGLRLNKWSFSVSEGAEWMFTAEFLGLTYASPAAKSTITYGSTQLRPTFGDVTVTWNSITLTTYPMSIKIDGDNGLQARFSTGSYTAREIYSNRDRKITATIEIALDSTLYNSFQSAHEAQTQSDLVITITDPAVSNRSITVTLNDAYITNEAWPESKGADMHKLTLNFEGVATASAEAVAVVVVNGISTATGNG